MTLGEERYARYEDWLFLRNTIRPLDWTWRMPYRTRNRATHSFHHITFLVTVYNRTISSAWFVVSPSVARTQLSDLEADYIRR